MPSKLTIANAEPQSLTLHALKGQFDGVTFFMGTMKLAECAEQLHFENTEEVKTFRERIQRTLDEKRAQAICDNYLKKHQMRFFNSLVVVLVPTKGTTTGYFEFEPFELTNGEQLKVGTLRVLSSIQRVVVDGQHRLYALRSANEYARTPEYDETLKLAEIQVPVVFLTFDEIGGGGFQQKYPDILGKVSDRARRIFVDLNKNAVRADKNTLYILDDRDFSAVVARELLEREAIPELELFTRWHGSATTLADADHCFTTIEVLNYFVTELVTDEREEEISTKFDLARDEERQDAVKEYFMSPSATWDGQIPYAMLTAFYQRLSFFSDWRQQIESILKGRPKAQPAEQEPSTEQKREIRALRRKHLLGTVAGQKAAIEAVLSAYVQIEKDDPAEKLKEAIRRLDQIHSLGLFDRDQPLWLELLTRPGDPPKMKLTAHKPTVRVLEGLILRHSREEIEEHITPLIDDGIGTEDTGAAYASALELLGD